MRPRTRLLSPLVLGIALAISACGGGGSDSAGSGRDSGGGPGTGAPPNSPIGAISDSDSAANSVSESAAIGTPVGITLRADDPDSGDTVSYSLANNDGGLFAVAASTGVVTVAGSLDFEQYASHTIRGRARSSDGTQSEADFRIDLVDDTQEILLQTSFPATSSAAIVHFSGAAIDVTGTVTSLPGDAIEVIVEADAFNVPADVDIDGRWRAQDVPLNPGSIGLTTLRVVANSQSGLSATTAVSISTAEMFSSPQAIAIDPPRNRAIVADSDVRALMAVDLATGQRSTLSGQDRGTGPQLGLFARVAINPAINIAYVWRSSQLLAIDLDSGDRTVLSDGTTGTGPLPQVAFGDIAIDISANRLILNSLDQLIAIDLATGNRSVVSGNGVGSGPMYGTPSGIAVLNTGQALVIDSSAGLFLVNLGNGSRTLVSSSTIGTGPALKGRMRVVADPPNNRAFVAGSELDVDLLAVNLSTGNRSEVSGTKGSGVNVFDPWGIALDAQSHRVLIADEVGNRVLAIDISSGDRTILSANNVGNGEAWFQISKVNLDIDNKRILAGARNDPIVYSIDLRSARKAILFDDSDGSGPGVASVSTAVFDKPNNRMLARSGLGIFSLDLSSGDRTLLSDPDRINGPSLTSIQDMAVDSLANRLLAVETDDRLNPTLIEIDLSTGLRATVSGPGLGSGPALDEPRGVALDMPLNRALVADLAAAGVLAIDLTTGNRSFVSDPADIFSAYAIAIDDTSRRLFALNNSYNLTALVEVDELTGARTEISGPNMGDGMQYGNFTDLALDMPNNRAFIVHSNGTEILLVDMVSGDRVVFAR